MMTVMSEGAGKDGEGYLRAYDQDLSGALSLLVHDLVATLQWKPERAESLCGNGPIAGSTRIISGPALRAR